MSSVDLREFDHDKVAIMDARMWRSYYNHKYISLFWQLLKLLKEQLMLGWVHTIRLAYYSAWAAADFRINRRNIDENRIVKNLTKFFKVISIHSLQQFDYVKAAQLELDWWITHRKAYKVTPELIKSLARAAAIIYGVDSAKLMTYAKYRAEAMILPRHDSDKVNKTDWTEVEILLKKSWASLHEAVR